MPGEIDNLQIQISAESESASQNILALAVSLESLTLDARNAVKPLTDLSKALSGIKGFNTTAIRRSADDVSKAFEQFNNVGAVENAVQFMDSIDNLRGAMSNLSDITKQAKDFKIGKGFMNSIEALSDALPKLSNAGNIEDSVAVLDSVQNLEEATAGLRNISSNINALKIGAGFDKNLENLSLAMAHLNEIGDTSAFAGGVEAISQAVEKLNNIEVGHGFINLVQASTQWGDALEKMNNYKLGSDFSQSIARVAKACEILNDVDFTGFKRMNEALASLPDNVRISFGSNFDTSEVGKIVQSVSDIKDRLATAFPDDDETADKLESTTGAIREVGAAAEQAISPIRKFNVALDAVGKGALKGMSASIRAIFSPLTLVGRKFAAASTKAEQFLSSIKRIALYRAVRSILKAITEGFEEGRKNLYYYSQAVGTDFAPSMDKAATAALYLKNSIGAATAPITNYLVPIIDKAVDHIVELINKFNELTAVLTGASTWTKALKYPTTWQDALDDAQESAKKLKSTMLGFDELNVIEQDSKSNKKNALSMDDYAKMFQEMATSATWQNNIPDLLLPVKLAWDAEGDNTIRTIKNTWTEIKSLIESVGDSFRTVWMNGTGQKTLEIILQIVQNIIGTFGELASGIRKAWDENENGTRIIQSVWNVANNLLTVFRDIWGSIRVWASELNWSPLLESLGELGKAFENLTDPNGALARMAKTVVDKLFLPLGKWLIEKGLPTAVDILASAFDALGTILEKLEPVFEKIIDFLGKVAGYTFNNISGLADSLSSLTDILTGKEVSDEKENRLRDTNSKMVDSLGGKDSTFGKINKTIEDWGARGLYDFVEWKKDGIEAFGEIGTAIKECFEQEIDLGFGDGIIPDKTMKDFNKDVKVAALGFDVIGNSAKGVIDITDDVQPTGGLIGAIEQLKSSTETFATDYAFKIGSMRDAWNGFTDSAVTKWDNFKTTVSDGMTAISNSVSSTWENVKTFFSDGWDAMKVGVSQFGEDWSNGWENMKESVSGMWESAKTSFETGWNAISDKADAFKSSFASSMESVKKSVTNAWTVVSKTLSSKWSDFKGFVKDYDKLWSDGFSSIKETVSTAWETIDGRLSNYAAWNTLKNAVTDYATNWFDKMREIKQNVSDAMQDIANKITNSPVGRAIGDVVDSIKETIGSIWGNETSGVKGVLTKIVNGVRNFIGTLFDGDHLGAVAEMLKGSLNNVIGAFETAVNYIIKGLNFFVEKVNDAFDIHIDIPDAVPIIGGTTFDGFRIPEIPEFSFYKFEKGGYPDRGSLFLANEPGNPELVGKIGSQTAVVNNEQIVEAVSKGVYEAMLAAMQRNSNNSESGKQELHIYLDRQELTAQVEQQQRDNGVSIIGGLVY